MNDRHIFNLVSDYVLELLPATERQRVERHVAGCTLCREAIMRERRIGQVVRTTLATATWPSAGRLTQLMPLAVAVAPRSANPWTAVGVKSSPARLQRLMPLTAVGLALLLLFGGFGLRWTQGPDSRPAHFAATSTTSPTLTATNTIIAATGTAVAPTDPAPTVAQNRLQTVPELAAPAPTPAIIVAMYSH